MGRKEEKYGQSDREEQIQSKSYHIIDHHVYRER